VTLLKLGLSSAAKRDAIVVANLCRKCNVTARCVTAAVRSVCGDDAADWSAELLFHVRAPYATCWRCGDTDPGSKLSLVQCEISDN